MINRFILIVLDSVGIGELPDAKLYGDEGSNTLVNLAKAVGGLSLPNLGRLGLGNITQIKGVKPESNPAAAIGKMAEKSAGKDTTTGHWEIAGLVLKKPFPLYPKGFPEEIIRPFKQGIGRDILGNKPASGTEIIEELGRQHLETGFPIVYTSADSVFQIAAHVDIIPIGELYGFCEIARKILVGKHSVSRVIARPFEGEAGEFRRVNHLRRDYSVAPFQPTILNALIEAGFTVTAIGKINDIFAGSGITTASHTENNSDGIDKTIEAIKTASKGLIFTNLIDFDMVYGHRNDAKGYAKALEEFDRRLVEIMEVLGDDDILILTADHGCDPTTKSTDHSREYVPLIVYGDKVKKRVNLGIRDTFADISATMANTFKLPFITDGRGFEEIFLKKGENEMTVVSEKIVRHINYIELEGDNINSKLSHLIEHEYRRRLTRYEYTDRMFQEKYGMSLEEFEEKEMVKRYNYSWEAESDLSDWEIACDGIKSMKRKLEELRRKVL